MKQKKGMIILIGVLAVLLILYAALNIWNKKTDEAEEKKTEEETIHLVDAENITGIKYTNGQETMSYTKEDGTWYYGEDREIPLDQDVIEEIAASVTGLTAVRELDDPDDLNDYGLTEPAYTLWYTEGGDTIPIYIGDMAGENYYVTVGDTKKVYTITDSLVSSMYFEISQIIQNDTVPTIGSGNLTKVTVTQNGNVTEYTEEDDLAQLAGGFGVLAFDTGVDYHVSEEKLSAYGLDEKSRVIVSASYTDSDEETEKTFTVYIGATDDSGENQYVMKKDSGIVYQVSKSVVENMTTIGEDEAAASE